MVVALAVGAGAPGYDPASNSAVHVSFCCSGRPCDISPAPHSRSRHVDMVVALVTSCRKYLSYPFSPPKILPAFQLDTVII